MFVAMIALLGHVAAATADPLSGPARGELLYANHCSACHTAQVHWRDKRIAKDWASLQAQVARWQKFSGLAWNKDDVTAVARYLNTRYYRYPISD
jgi:mono/diheme cytochrome c family protein